MASDYEIEQAKPVLCNIPTCGKRFTNITAMKRHKKNDPEHFYCRRCDVDCEDDDDLTLHKVYAMQPFLEGHRPHFEGDEPMHIVCEFCGMDFKTFGGRRLHRLKVGISSSPLDELTAVLLLIRDVQEHQAAQHVVCPGCNFAFARAGHLIYHLEEGWCENIPKHRFFAHVQQIIIHEEIWKDPETIQSNLARNQQSKELARIFSHAYEDFEYEDGGVDLLSHDDEQSQKLGIEPLRAEFDLMDVRDRCDTLDAGTSPEHSCDRGGGVKLDIDEYPELGSKDIIRETSPRAHSGGWGASNTPRALFKHAEPAPRAGDWEAILNDRKEALEVAQGPGLLQCRFWDPTSRDYNGDIFYNHIDRRYKCPFQGCETACYEIETDLHSHLQYGHLSCSYDCPLCGKRFETGSALINHSETPAGKCKVKDTKLYGKLLHRVSGGFLKVEHLRLPKLAKGEQLLPGGGLMGMKFTAEIPERAKAVHR